MKQSLILILCLFSSASAIACGNPGDAGCITTSGGLTVGDMVYAVSGARADTAAHVVGIQTNGQFVIRFDSDSAVGGDWDRNQLAATFGCVGDVCVGTSIYSVTGARADSLAAVVGIQTNGQYVLRFDSDGAVGDSWSRASIAKREGCVNDLCVGTKVYAVTGARADTLAEIVGVQTNGQYVLRFDSDGAIGDSWDRNQLAATNGGVNGLSVGTRVYAVSGARQGSTAVIVAIQKNGQFVLRFDSDGAVGDSWSRDQIVCVQN